MLLTEISLEVAAVPYAGRGVLVGLREEVWQGEDEGTGGQEETPNADQSRTVHPAAEVADEDDEDGVADLVQTGNETRGRTGEPKALLDGGEAALEVGAVQELAELQEAVAEHKYLNVAKDGAGTAAGSARGGAAALARAGLGQEPHGGGWRAGLQNDTGAASPTAPPRRWLQAPGRALGGEKPHGLVPPDEWIGNLVAMAGGGARLGD